MGILVIAEHDGTEVKPHTLNTVTAAAAAGGDVHVAVIGSGCAAAADAAAKIAGVSKVLLADAAEYDNQMAESIAPAIVAMSDGYDAVYAPANTFGKNVMPRVAALMDVQQVSEVSAILGDQTYERPIYAGNAIATVKSSEAKDVVTVRMTSFDPAAEEGGAAAVEAVGGTGGSDLSEYLGQSVTESDRPELTSAKIVVSGGRGMQSGDNFGMLEKVADKLNAAVGASRAAVDAGFVPNDYQVGQTGKVVAPDLYIAVGISGAIQHLAGMKDSKVIVAINKDDEAPIFQVADYGLVADLFDAVPALDGELG